MRWIRHALLLATWAWVTSAQAQVMVVNRVGVDFYQGPVVSSSRVVGMGGAYIGVAEGADGHLINPAAYAVRPSWLVDDWYDWDITLSFLNVRENDELDLDQSGVESAFEDASYAQLGGNLKFGRHAVGAHVANQRYGLVDDTGRSADYEQGFGGLGYAYAFSDGEVILGAMVLGGNARFQFRDRPDPAVQITGGGIMIGGLLCPRETSWRLGGVLRTEIIGDQVDEGDETLQGTAVPDVLLIPWEAGVGFSYMWGPRTYNVVGSYGDWEDAGEARPERNASRKYVLAAIDVLVTGPAREPAVGVQSFLRGETRAAGQNPNYSLRAGLESEIIEDLLVVRGGGYYEPSRFEQTAGRLHGTLGADYHFDMWWALKLSTSLDVADGWVNFGLGLGFWH